MERKIVDKLNYWKKRKNRKPLIINGARQVGKTYISLLFGKLNYKNYVYFNFERSSELMELFSKTLDTDRILDGLRTLSGENIFKKDTLIIFDEIQVCPRAFHNETMKIMRAYESIPNQLAKENKKFQYKIIKSGARANEYEVPLHWLKDSGLINICTKVSEGKLPLIAYCDTPSFKIYMSDTGLLSYKSNILPNYIFSKDERFNGFKSSLVENYVCSSLVNNDFTLYYWEDNGKNELDFLIQDKEGKIIPIEVKSSTNIRSRSLMTFMKRYSSEYAIRISMKNFGYDNEIRSIPLYATFCIDKNI